MMSAQNVNVPIQHYVKKIKEHEEKRLSFNQRASYWREYYEQMGRLVSQSERNNSSMD